MTNSPQHANSGGRLISTTPTIILFMEPIFALEGSPTGHIVLPTAKYFRFNPRRF